MTTVYGIPNCDSVTKANKWLENRGITYRFHDFRKDGLNADIINTWRSCGATQNMLLNKRSTTWKQLSSGEQEQAAIDALALMVQHPTLIKRPVIHSANSILVGFKEEAYQQLLNEESR